MDIKFANYGQERDINCTEEEREIFDTMRSLLDDVNLESDLLKLVNKSDKYVSAVMESSGDYGLLDVARIKFTSRAKWIALAPNFEKIKITDTEDITKYAEELAEAYRFNEPYL